MYVTETVCGPQSLEYLLSGPSKKMFAGPWSKACCSSPDFSHCSPLCLLHFSTPASPQCGSPHQVCSLYYVVFSTLDVMFLLLSEILRPLGVGPLSSIYLECSVYYAWVGGLVEQISWRTEAGHKDCSQNSRAPLCNVSNFQSFSNSEVQKDC